MKASTSANMASAPTTSKFSLHWPGGMVRRPAFRCSSCEHALGRYESADPFFYNAPVRKHQPLFPCSSEGGRALEGQPERVQSVAGRGVVAGQRRALPTV
jgi:hypothetical protein